jgi:sigma-B regulation protein RsbU (phosphoserine phosphatase)
MREEMAVAREIQQALLPDSFPSGPNFAVSGINLPSREIGGDYFDFIVTSQEEDGSIQKLLMVVGDVSGKGTPAALLMASLQATLRAVYEVQPDLAATIEKVNKVIYQTTAAEKFVTLFVAEMDIETRVLTYVNAGHNFPILTRSSGEQLLLEDGGLLVGAIEHTTYEKGAVQMEPGDVLAIYTDGVTETQNSTEEEFGEERLQITLRDRSYLPPREIRDEVYREVLSYAGDQAQFDDLTLVVLKCM